MKKFFLFLAAVALAMTANAKVTTISPDAENDALRLAVHYAEDGDIIEMTEGTYVQCNNGYVAFDGKSVTVKAAEGANVVLQLQVPITITNGGKANLQGIKIDASRLNDLADWYEHVIYATDATEGKELVMQGCELYGFGINKSAIYSSSSNTLALCDVKDCYFHDNMKSCFFFEGASIAELSVVNSTFANIATDASSYYAGIIDVRNADAKVTVDHCTFYNCLLINTDYAAVTMKGPQAANVVIANNIFMLPEAIDGHRAIRNDVEATNCMTFNYVKDNGGIHSSVTKTNCFLNVDPLFVDAANGNFALAEGSPAIGAATDGSNLGDPRWNATVEEDETKVPTNLELWEAFKPYYNEYYGLARADQPIDKVSTFAAAKMQEIMTDPESEYKWLGDYVWTIANDQGVTLSTDMAAANEGGWRWAVHAFFNATTGANGAAGTDFTEAGKPENWGPYYLAAKNDTTPEIEWIPMDLEITNLTTEVMEVEGAKYLLLQGRDDMNDADVMLFLNNYADVDGDYEVNTESSFMTFGGLELTVLEGVMTQTSETDKGTIYTGTVRASVEEEGETMYVEFALTMYAAPATVIELTDAIVAINEELGTLTFNVPTGEGEGYYAELAGYTAPGVHEGPQICLFMTPEVVAYTNYAETSVADGVITLKGEFVSPMGPKFDVTISGKLPEVEKPELPAASIRAWAYDLALAVEGEQYTFSYKATTAALATLILTDAEGTELATVDLGLVEAGANTAVLAASELPAGEKVNWAVKLEAGAVENLVEVTDQSRGIYDFYNMMDVLVDNNPESEYFGKIYIQMAYNGASDGMTTRSQTQTAGVFIYDQELNELNDPSNVGIKPTLPEGYTMGDNRNKFHRLEIDPKTGNLTYCYNVAGQPAIFSIDRANMTGEVTNLLAGVEGITRTSAHCFDEDGTLYVYDLPGAGIIHKVVDGVASVLAASDAKWVQASATMATDGRGGLWVAQNRGQIDTYYQLAHYTAEGTIDFAVYQGSENGFSGSSTRGAMVYDAERQLLAQGRNGAVEVYSVAYDAETGVPTLTLVATTPSVGTNIDGLAFDYAGDLYVVNSSKEKFQKFAMPTANNVCTTPAASKYAFEVAEPVEMVGVVKRAVQNGDEVIILTHEADGAAHIYKVVNGVVKAEISQEGVIAVDPENAGDMLAISDIAITEDGKLLAINKIVCQAGDAQVDEGYKRGETRVYIWNDLAGAPSVWFTSKMASNWYRSVQGQTMAYKGTSTNGTLVTTGITATGNKFRYSVYNVIDGVYTDPPVNDSEHYHYTKGSAQTTDNIGANYEINFSLLAENTWVLDGELIDPFEITDPLTYNTEVTAGATVNEDLGKKYNGATYVTVGEKVLMVAPYANPDGQLVGVEILNISNGLDNPVYVDMVYVEEAVAVEAAATAVEVVEGGLNITLVADAAIQTWFVELSDGPVFEIYEEEITNLVIDLDNLVLIGGPSANLQVDVYLPLGEYNMSEDSYQLTAESSIAVMGSDATFIEGYAYEVDAFTPSAKAVVRCEWNGMLLEFHLTMTAAPLEPTVVVVEDAMVEIEKYQIWGDMYDYALTMTGEWVNPEDGLTYPVLVEVPVYYPDATEPTEIMSTVTVGGWGDEDPWLGFGEGTLTVTTVNNVVTATGVVQNPMAGVAIDITISGKIITDALENVEATVAPVKVIKNGQLIIIKNGVEFNVQGAVVK